MQHKHEIVMCRYMQSSMNPSKLPYVTPVDMEHLQSLSEDEIIEMLISTTANIVRIAEQLIKVRQDIIDERGEYTYTPAKRQRKA